MTLQRANMWSASTPVDPIQYYEVGGSNIDPAVSTSDYYHTCGLYGFRPYDLLTWGSEGAALASSYGYRYVWLGGPDHPTSNTQIWRDSAHFMVGFSNDPGTLPVTLTPIIAWNNNNTSIHDTYPTGEWNTYEWGWATYNPDDVNSLPFYFSGEGASLTNANGIQHCQILWRSSDLLTWTAKKVSHSGTDGGGWASFNVTKRLGVNNWKSRGTGSLTGPPGSQGVPFAQWISTNGIDYTLDGGTAEIDRYRKSDGTVYNTTEVTTAPLAGVPAPTISELIGGIGDDFSIGGQSYWVVREAEGIWVTRPTQYLSIIPVDSVGNVQSSPAPTRISSSYAGAFPGPTFVQMATYLKEDGILHIYATHGFQGPADTASFGYPYPVQWDLAFVANGSSTAFSGSTLRQIKPYSIVLTSTDGVTYYDNGLGAFVGAAFSSSSINYVTKAISVTFASPPAAGNINIRYVENDTTYHYESPGGLREQFIDYHTYIYDSTAAAASAPAGVTASCDAGVVTLSWYDALPHQNYRVYKGSSSGTQATLVGDVTGLSTTHSPASDQQWWFKVVTLNGGSEAGYRVVHCYVSSASELANKHINRVIDDGGDSSKINVTKLDLAITFLEDQGWMQDLLFWASPDWGIKESAGHLVKIYCLGTTRLPRGGDLTFDTSATTYAASGIGERGVFVNPNTNSFGYFGGGKFNPIQKKRQITVAAMYLRTQTSSDITFVGLKTSNGKYEGSWAGTEQPGISLSHNSGSPGTVEFKLKDDNFGSGVRQNTATVTSTGGTYEVAIGTFDGSEVVAYSNGTAGTAVTGVDPDPHHFRDTALAGARGNGLIYPVLGVGSRNCYATASANPTSFTAPTRSYPANEAKFKASDIFIMARGVDATDASALTDLFDSLTIPSTALTGVIKNAGGVTVASTSWTVVMDGATDNRTVLETARAWAIANVTTPLTDRFYLTFPAGTCYIGGTGGQFYVSAASETSCVHNMTITGQGEGVTILTNLASGSPHWSFGSYATSPSAYWGVDAANNAARIATVGSGSTRVTVSNFLNATFSVGQYVLIAGLDVQALALSVYGYPVNPAFNDYAKITDISGSIVTLDRPLKYDYKSTWPEISTFNPGPAGMMPLPLAFDLDLVVQDLTITQGGGGTKCDGRSITFRNVTVDSLGLTPSQNMLFWLDTVSHAPSIEIDKMVDHLLIDTCTMGNMSMQSSSVDLIEILDSTVDRLYGTSKRFICRGSTITDFRVGCTSYGASDSADISDSTVAVITSDDDITTPVFERCGAAFGASDPGVNHTYTMSGGVIKVPNGRLITNAVDNGSGNLRLTVGTTAGITSGLYMLLDGLDFTGPSNEISQVAAIATVINGTTVDITWPFPGGTYSNVTPGLLHCGNPFRWAVYGKNLIFRGTQVYGAPFHITDITQGTGTIDIQTNLAGTWPAIPLTSDSLGIMVHGCPRLTLSNVSGHHLYDEMHDIPAAGPLYSNYNRTIDGSSQNAGLLYLRSWGSFVQFEVNVITPYAGGGALTFYPFSNFDTLKSDFSTYTWSPEINAKISGIRRVTLVGGVPTITVGSGISGDTGLAPPEAVMCTGGPGVYPRYSANPGGAANVSIEVTLMTDQSIFTPDPIPDPSALPDAGYGGIKSFKSQSSMVIRKGRR